MMETPAVFQPLHESIRGRLDSEYVAFHDAVLQHCPRSETLPFDPVASRAAKSPMVSCSKKVVEVGSIVDRTIYTGSSGQASDQVTVRIFTPEGTAPTSGWPCLMWYHGGGWVVGGLGSENGFLTHICKCMYRPPETTILRTSYLTFLSPDLHCIVISVNYRHAPEHMYPCAADDSFFGYRWVVEPAQVAELGIDTSKMALGGLSAGGGLAAIVGMKIAESSNNSVPCPVFQMLICPVIDNTVTVDTDPADRAGWKASQHAPWLTPTRMQWYRHKYFGAEGHTSQGAAEWTASPCYAPPDIMAQSPPTFLGIAACDLLAPEAAAFGERLAAAGVPVNVQTYAGGTHSILILAG